MKIEIQIDERCDEPKIVVMTRRVTEEISEILKKLSEDPSEMLAGFRNERASILEPKPDLSGVCLGRQGLCRSG